MSIKKKILIALCALLAVAAIVAASVAEIVCFGAYERTLRKVPVLHALGCADMSTGIHERPNEIRSVVCFCPYAPALRRIEMKSRGNCDFRYPGYIRRRSAFDTSISNHKMRLGISGTLKP